MSEAIIPIGEIARRAGVRKSRIRYYESIGLLPVPERVSGQRRYDETVLRRLAIIDVAARAGLSLDDIRELLDHGDEAMSERLRELVARRLPAIEELIERAAQVRVWLEGAASCRCGSFDACPLFDVELPPTVTPR